MSKNPDFVRKDGPMKCTWHLGTKEKSPHTHYPSTPRPKICNTILENVGNTPMVRINSISKEVPCEILAKCEFFNSGGSVKDRIGRRMVEEAEKTGRIKKGDILIEPTSGNTGIGLALAAAVKGYKCIITMPEKMSQEKVDVLKGLGAEIVRTPTSAAWDAPESHMSVAENLRKTLPNAHILDQYINPNNPLAHYDFTAEEIWDQCDGKLDMIVMGAGTGGTAMGISRKLKELNPNIIVVCVDPHGSILAQPEELNATPKSYQVEGIGYDFIPTVCDRHPDLVDKWYKVDDKPSFLMARRLIREEGILCGGSSGCAMYIALQAAKDFKLTKDHRVVVLLADGVRNYMSKFLNDDWMRLHGFVDDKQEEEIRKNEEERWKGAVIQDLKLRPAVYIREDQTIQEAIKLMQINNFDQLPVVNDKREPKGYITVGNLVSRVTSGRVQSNDPVSKAMFTLPETMTKLYLDTPLSYVNSVAVFERHPAAFVLDKANTTILHVFTAVDIYEFMNSRDNNKN